VNDKGSLVDAIGVAARVSNGPDFEEEIGELF
jgi:hypothetical protein